jgi:hypothetical protein
VNFFEQLAVGWQAIARTLARLAHPAPWLPLALLGVFQLASLAMLWWFAHPAVSWFMAPVLQHAGGDPLLHYPNVFRLLPELYGRVDLVLGATVGAVAVGAATRIFADEFQGRPAAPAIALQSAIDRGVTLVLVSLPFNLLVFALSFGLDWFLSSRGSGGLVRQLSDAIVLSASVILQSLFFYVVCDVMIGRRSVIGALAGVPRAAARGFWAALVIGILLALPLLPLHFLSNHSSLLVERGAPELVGALVVVEIAIGLVLWFGLAGSATLVYLTLVWEETREASP